ncbi:opioid growth factor receptor-related protein [Chroococcidiopsis sp. CCALA 051]|uniref:opioid growth factor receptor-related protein n=1 Tax=Chroococcidiopsis sp. CCALA 051 TaxID=869949 RepID=UPI0018EDDD53|nr:opioid growth factor receptor-related protein [Chroococcidiopsis sp. CCALA 051]
MPERSSFNSNAPIVDYEVIQAFHANTRLRQNLLRSFTVMLGFYGLQGDSDNNGQFVVTRSEEYPIRKKEWICPLDHNYLRITRILKCLMALGLESYAQSFCRCLEQIYREESRYIGGETFQYWTNAVKKRVNLICSCSHSPADPTPARRGRCSFLCRACQTNSRSRVGVAS